ncbi:MAG: preprotein translocase subunit YajC, partial [SAR324 cluster bacterium]|nr:preprotein translocase subunit YajC [SAR324 cluster bacterium]
QQKKAKEHGAMLEELNKNDKIITGSGIYGKIDQKPDPTEDFVFVEIADKTVIKILKSQVSEMVKLPSKKTKEDKKEKNDKKEKETK